MKKEEQKLLVDSIKQGLDSTLGDYEVNSQYEGILDLEWLKEDNIIKIYLEKDIYDTEYTYKITRDIAMPLLSYQVYALKDIGVKVFVMVNDEVIEEYIYPEDLEDVVVDIPNPEDIEDIEDDKETTET